VFYQYFFRGGSVFFSVTFYDENNVVQQPASAFVNITYPDSTGNRQTLQFALTQPVFPNVAWTGFLDTKNMGSGPVDWSIHSSGFPDAVKDGTFVLTANSANLATFP